MSLTFKPLQKQFYAPSFFELYQALKRIAPDTPPLISGGDRPLKMTFEDQLNALIFYHLEKHVSGSPYHPGS